MSFNLDKFQNLPYLQKRKKLCYYIHRAVSERDLSYIVDIKKMVESINKSEYRDLTFEETPDGLKAFYKTIQQQILENDPFQEDILFDDPQKERQLLPQPVGIILENIRSPFNVGAFFRMGEAFGIHDIIIIGATPSPEKQEKIRKTAKGELIPFCVFETLETFLTTQNKKPVLLAIEKAKGSVPLESFQPSLVQNQPCYLIFGNEEFGVSPLTLAMCQSIYHIPMYGNKNSLNVSVAGGIVLNHLAQIYF